MCIMRSKIQIILYEHWIRMNTPWPNVYLNILHLYAYSFDPLCFDFTVRNSIIQFALVFPTCCDKIHTYIYIRFLCLLLMGWVTSKGWTIGTYDQAVVDFIVGGRLDGKLRNCHEKWEGNDAHNLVVKDDNGPILTFVDDLPNYMSMG